MPFIADDLDIFVMSRISSGFHDPDVSILTLANMQKHANTREKGMCSVLIKAKALCVATGEMTLSGYLIFCYILLVVKS